MANVLIVDDASFMRIALRTMLDKNGFKVIGEAEDGMSAILKYKQFNPDIVTLDVTMPDIDGIQVLREIKKYDSSARIVMITAMGQKTIVKKAVLNGAKSFIVKPFKEEHLIQTLNSVMFT